MSEAVRLQKYLAQCGVASRRKAESLIADGRVTVDGEVVRDMGLKVDPRRQQILFDGKPVRMGESFIYILLNKPKGYVTTVSDPQGRPIVTSLVGNLNARLFPVGRLDLDTEGALILTNDGEFAQKVQHSSFEVKKTYEATVAGFPSEGDIRALERGILLEGRMTSPASLRILQRTSRTTLVEVVLHEGRKRQVRKMFRAVDHPVLHLKRTAYGRLRLGDLAEGRYRLLNAKDLNKIFKNIALQKKN